MKIVNLKKSRLFKYRFQIIFENGICFSVNENLVTKYNLKKNSNIDENILNEIKDNEFKYLKKYSEKYFKRYNSSKENFKRKLFLKKFSPENIDKTIKYLENINLINDSIYAHNYVISMVNRLKYSRFGLEYKLFQKKISRDLITKYLDIYYTEDIERETINKLIDKLKNRYKDTRKLKQYLLNKKFNYSIVSELVI